MDSTLDGIKSRNTGGNQIIRKQKVKLLEEKGKKATPLMDERKKGKLLHFHSWCHEMKGSSKNQFINIKDRVTSPNKKTGPLSS